MNMAKLNRRQAIRKRCLDCIGNHPSLVAACDSVDCQLHPYRHPVNHKYPKGAAFPKGISKERAKAIREHCLWCSGDSLKERRECAAVDCSLWKFRMG